MGTHPIFESDFDCLTDLSRHNRVSVWVWIDAEFPSRARSGVTRATNQTQLDPFLLRRHPIVSVSCAYVRVTH